MFSKGCKTISHQSTKNKNADRGKIALGNGHVRLAHVVLVCISAYGYVKVYGVR